MAGLHHLDGGVGEDRCGRVLETEPADALDCRGEAALAASTDTDRGGGSPVTTSVLETDSSTTNCCRESALATFTDADTISGGRQTAGQ